MATVCAHGICYNISVSVCVPHAAFVWAEGHAEEMFAKLKPEQKCVVIRETPTAMWLFFTK